MNEAQAVSLWSDERIDTCRFAGTSTLGVAYSAKMQMHQIRDEYEADRAQLLASGNKLIDRIAELERELAKAKKPLLTMDEVNALEELVKDTEYRSVQSAMLKLKSQHCTYESPHSCHGELWECAECGDVHCCVEGGDTDVELCDSCWAEKHKAATPKKLDNIPY